jgi:hypothetical protein
MANQVSKLNFVDQKLGAPTSGQQTTRIVYDTILSPTGTTLEFFKTFQGKTIAQTNLTTNKLDSMESMVIKSLWFAQFNASGLNPALGDGFNNEVPPIICSVYVGNQQVIKNLPINFNTGRTGQAFDRLHAGSAVAPNSSIISGGRIVESFPAEVRLLTDIVIPPQTSFSVKLEAAAGADFSYNSSVVTCALSGYGKIFSAGSSF